MEIKNYPFIITTNPNRETPAAIKTEEALRKKEALDDYEERMLHREEPDPLYDEIPGFEGTRKLLDDL